MDLHTSSIKRKGSGGKRKFQEVGSGFLKNEKWMQNKKDLALPKGEFSQISFFFLFFCKPSFFVRTLVFVKSFMSTVCPLNCSLRAPVWTKPD